MDKIAEIEKEARKELQRIVSLAELEAFWRGYFGSSGKVSALMSEIKNMPAKSRPEFGREVNALKGSLAQLFDKRKRAIVQEERKRAFARERLDVTRPGKKVGRGSLHPLTAVEQQIQEIFFGMGFSVVSGPEVETERYNFDALNIPADHPARDMWDTLWLRQSEHSAKRIAQNDDSRFAIRDKLLLRTHTSPVQIRYMEQHEPPFRIIVPGRVFRYEATDASHDIQFHQVEGLMVGQKDRDAVSVANFKAVIRVFLEQFFSAKGGSASGGKNPLKIRLRPSYFPFVEPGFEVDISCTICSGKGCSVCKQGGWLEVMGAGMVHPNVFDAVGYNPDKAQGFAFGMGLERLAMLKYKIPDIRLFRSGDIRFLKQFS